jgi:hypothetical protein
MANLQLRNAADFTRQIRTGTIKLQYSLLDTKPDVDQEITLKIYDGMVAYHVPSLKCRGVLDHDTGQALAALSRNYSMMFQAFLDEKTSIIKRNTSNDGPSLLITLYGLRQDSDAVGALLSENNLYLQQPSTFNPSTVYFNPQYLLRPGAEFNLVAQRDSKSSIPEKKMGEAIKHQMLHVFDSAAGPTAFSEMQGSKRLITCLKLYVSLDTCFFAFLTSSVAKSLQLSEESPGFHG